MCCRPRRPGRSTGAPPSCTGSADGRVSRERVRVVGDRPVCLRVCRPARRASRGRPQALLGVAEAHRQDAGDDGLGDRDTGVGVLAGGLVDQHDPVEARRRRTARARGPGRRARRRRRPGAARPGQSGEGLPRVTAGPPSTAGGAVARLGDGVAAEWCSSSTTFHGSSSIRSTCRGVQSTGLVTSWATSRRAPRIAGPGWRPSRRRRTSPGTGAAGSRRAPTRSAGRCPGWRPGRARRSRGRWIRSIMARLRRVGDRLDRDAGQRPARCQESRNASRSASSSRECRAASSRLAPTAQPLEESRK